MVVVTRSRSRSSSGSSSGSRDYIQRRTGSTGSSSSRSVKILTPSLREASVRSYKIYNGSNLKSTHSPSDLHHAPSPSQEEIFDAHAAEAEEAARTLTELKTMNKYSCMNPMHPITRYMYRMQVYNSSRTHHYRTAFIGYNNKTRLYYVHTIISNCYRDTNDADTATDDVTGLPRPVNTIQTKYSSYTTETIENYIMTMMVPSREYDYYIQDDIIGVVTTESEFGDAVFGEDSSYYDVERLLHDESSNETINGFKAFSLIPSRNYWFDPLVAETHSSAYSSYTIHSVLNILSQSQ